MADTPTKTAMSAGKPVKTIKPTEMTCQEFRINTLVPVLVEDCAKNPGSSYWQKMKIEFKKFF